MRLVILLGLLQCVIQNTNEKEDKYSLHKEKRKYPNDVKIEKPFDFCDWEGYSAADVGPCMDKKNEGIERGFGDTLPDRHKHRQKRVAKHRFKWPKHTNGQVYVPYEYHSYEYSPGQDVRDMFMKAAAYIHNVSCVRLVPREGDENYVQVIDDKDGCYSLIGMQGGPQPLAIQSRSACVNIGTTIHEILHVLGFMHEMARRDRDKHITVHYENLRTDNYFQFEKHLPRDSSVYGEDYDVESIMHYGSHAFTRNGNKTITDLHNENSRLGQRFGMSEKDIKQLNKMYQCEQFILRV